MGARFICESTLFGDFEKEVIFIIRWDIPLLNLRTYLRMYLRKAPDDHRPVIIIMKTGISSMNIAIAAAEQVECVPISLGENTILSFPMLAAQARKDFRRSFCVNSRSLPSTRYLQMDDSGKLSG